MKTRLTILLLMVNIFGFFSCTEIKEKADEKWELLNDKAEKLDSVINFEINKLGLLDLLLNN